MMRGKIRNLMRYIYFNLFRILYIIYPYNILKRYRVWKAVFFSFWLKHGFKKCGAQVMFYGVDLLEGEKYIMIGENTAFGKGLYLTAWSIRGATPNLSIAKNCSFGAYNHISCSNEIVIDEEVLTGKFVSIVDNSHGETDYETLLIQPTQRPCVSKGSIYIGKRVWIGDKVTILPNVTIGEGCVIGANSVITRDIPPYSVVVGNPAQIIKTYIDEHQSR